MRSAEAELGYGLLDQRNGKGAPTRFRSPLDPSPPVSYDRFRPSRLTLNAADQR
jgi:hypothetical protein